MQSLSQLASQLIGPAMIRTDNRRAHATAAFKQAMGAVLADTTDSDDDEAGSEKED